MKSEKADVITWEADFWNEDSMRRALNESYRTLLIERRYGDPLGRTVRDGIPFGDVVAAHRDRHAGNRTFEPYQRRG